MSETAVAIMFFAGLQTLVVAGLVTWLLIGGRSAQKVTDVWRAAAEQLGITDIEVVADVAPMVGGRFGDMRVSIGPAMGRLGDDVTGGTEVLVSGALPASLGIRPNTSLMRLFDGADIELGDPEFDSTVRVAGDMAEAIAAFDHETRRAFTAAVGRGVRLHQRQIGRLLPGRPRTVEEAVAALSDIMALAKRLLPPADPVERIATIAATDPVVGVRGRAILLLAERFAKSPRSRDVLIAALANANPELRLRAGVALGKEGWPTLRELAGNPQVTEALALEAAQLLGSAWAVPQAADAIRSAIERGRDALASELIDNLGRVRGTRAAAALVALLSTAPQPLVSPLIRALGETGDPSAEPALIDMLGGSDFEARLAAAETLARVGTTAAVAPLHGAVATSPLDLGLRRAVATAIAEIQQRLTGASPGQLALADDQAGRLAVAEGDSGQLSVVEKDLHGGTFGDQIEAEPASDNHSRSDGRHQNPSSEG
jgi:HEAT repeat protein